MDKHTSLWRVRLRRLTSKSSLSQPIAVVEMKWSSSVLANAGWKCDRRQQRKESGCAASVADKDLYILFADWWRHLPHTCLRWRHAHRCSLWPLQHFYCFWRGCCCCCCRRRRRRRRRRRLRLASARWWSPPRTRRIADRDAQSRKLQKYQISELIYREM